MKNWALVPLAALGAGHLANAANVNRAIENELFPHLKTCGVSTGSHGKIKEEVTLRSVFFGCIDVSDRGWRQKFCGGDIYKMLVTIRTPTFKRCNQH